MTSLRPLLPALALTLSGSAFAQVVLDDYSSDRFASDYAQKNVPGFAPGGWSVTGGELRPDSVTSAGGYAAFVWTGHSLQTTGDWFSIDLSVAAASGDQNAGLSLWASSDGSAFDRLFEPRLGYNSNYAFIGSDQDGQVWAENLSTSAIDGGFVTLRVTLVGYDGEDAWIDFGLFNADGAISAVHRYTVAGHNGPIFVGPSAWQAAGTNVAFDNLTYYSAAIPEPSAFAATLGVFTLAIAASRRTRPKPCG